LAIRHFPNIENAEDTESESEEEEDEDIEMKKVNDIDEYFEVNKKEKKERIFDDEHNDNIPPAKLSYPESEIEFLVNSKISDVLQPKLESENVGSCTFSICPSLPDGVDFDVESGVISGFPMISKQKQLYTITAQNVHGSATFNMEAVIPSSNFNEKQKQQKQKQIKFGFKDKKDLKIKNNVRFETAEEQKNAFYELLANKGVRPQSTWSSIQRKIKSDPRYNAFDTEQERKSAFREYKTDLILSSGNNQQIMAEKKRLISEQSNFKNYLREILNSEHCNMEIEEIQDLLQGDERYHILDDVPNKRRMIIVDHLEVIQYQKEIETKQNKIKLELEEKQNFMMLLHELSFNRIHPLFHTKTDFNTLCKNDIFLADQRFATFVNSDNLRIAHQYFQEFCIAMDHLLEADRQILKSFMFETRFKIKHNHTINHLLKCLGKSSRLSMIETPHLRLLFNEMIQTQKQKEIEMDRVQTRRHSHREKKKKYKYDKKENNSSSKRYKSSSSKYKENKSSSKKKTKSKKKEDGEIEEKKLKKNDDSKKKKEKKEASKNKTKSKENGSHKNEKKSSRRDHGDKYKNSRDKDKESPNKSKYDKQKKEDYKRSKEHHSRNKNKDKSSSNDRKYDKHEKRTNSSHKKLRTDSKHNQNDDRWRGGDVVDIDRDDGDKWKYKENKRKRKKREIESVRDGEKHKNWKEPATKKRKKNNKKYDDIKKEKVTKKDNIDNNDRWQPLSKNKEYSSSTSSTRSRERNKHKKKNKNKDKDKMDIEEAEKLKDKHRTPRERMLRQKLLAQVKKKK